MSRRLREDGRLRRALVRVAACLVLCASLLLPVKARADDWVTGVPRTADGAGVKLGKRSVFHPGMAMTFGLDSNPFWASPSEGKRPAGFAQPSGWASIGNRPMRDGVLDSPPEPTSSRVDYAIDVMAGQRLYMTREPTLFAAGRFNLGLRARILINPGRRFSVALEEDFRRIGEPRQFEALREYNFNRFDHAAALRLIIRPGGGKFSITGSYINRILYFQAQDLATGDRVVNGAEANLKWRFRDRTALVADYQFLNTYYACCVETGTGRNEDSRAHRALAGVAGALGKRWAIDVMLGYGAGVYYLDRNGPDFGSFIGRAGVGWYPRERTQLRLRLSRHFNDSLLGNYATDLGGEFDFSQQFRWRMLLTGGVSFYYRRYGGLPVPGTEIERITSYVGADGFVRQDRMLSLFMQLEQPFGRFFVLAARYDLRGDFTDFGINFENGVFDDAGFVRHMATLFGAVRF